MNYWNKFKTDRKFRLITVIIIYLVILLISNSPNIKKEADQNLCDTFNNGDKIHNIPGCIQNGCVAVFDQMRYTTALSGTVVCSWNAFFGSGDGNAICKARGPLGNPFLAASKFDADNFCTDFDTKTTYTSVDMGQKQCGVEYYTCRTLNLDDPSSTDSKAVCKSWQTPFSKVADMVGLKGDCSSRAMIVIFFGGLIALMVIFMGLG